MSQGNYKLFKCECCNRFLGKAKLIDAADTDRFKMELLLYCNNRKCRVARDEKLNGENVFVISPKK
jgi:hypothetical protein